jgi:Amt family ammonium transporter
VACIGFVAWVLWGYSFAFTDGGSWDSFVGGNEPLFLKDVTPASNVATFSTGVVIPEYVFISFQATFAAITAALVVGSLVERMKFAAIVAFAILWPLLVYYPMAHMVWWWPGPDAIALARPRRSSPGLIWASAPSTSPAAPSSTSTPVSRPRRRPDPRQADQGYGKEPMPPHSLTLTLVGAGLLWVGWFGFNAGSAWNRTATPRWR